MKYLDEILTIQGWMAPIELQWLYKLAANLPDGGIIVETGAWRGRSSAALCLGAFADQQENEKTIVSIDTWQGSPKEMTADLMQLALNGDIVREYIATMNRFALDVQPYQTGATGPRYIVGDSVESASWFADDSIDALFIDCDHYQCGAVIDAFLPKIKTNGGVLSGHDYFCFYDTIQQELHKRTYIHEIVYSIWIRWFGNERPGFLPGL